MPEKQLNFNPETHEYTLDGVVLPSVTQVLPETHFCVSEDRLEEIRQEGIDNHSLVKMFWDTGDTFGEPYLERFKALMEEIQPTLGQIIQYETPLASAKHRFAGTPDMVFGNGIVDLKRSKPGRNVSLQLAGYALLSWENKITGKKGVRLAVWDNGTEFKMMNAYDERAEDVFLACVKKYHTENYINQYLRGNVA
jgi:hypothetical protein